MSSPSDGPAPGAPQAHRLLAYIAELELEVDRLRKHGQVVRQEARRAAKQVLECCEAPADGDPGPRLAAAAAAARGLAEVLRQLADPPGYHPAHDQVVAIAARPLIEQVFRWQQRVTAAPGVELRLTLEIDHVDWFPARFRHIVDNLLSNALRYRDPGKAGSWVEVALRATDGVYELRVSDNGVGFPARGPRDESLGLFYRAAPARAAGLGVGLPVVRLLVEQSGGTLAVDSGEGQGTTFVVALPRYEVNDFLV